MRVVFISLLLFQLISLNLSIDLDTYYKDYIEKYGYKLEENPVTTDDGYILSLWHLYPKVPNGKVAFIQHGFAGTAWIFFQLGENSLPFLLLNEGYDVWLGNLRGNIFSRKHVSKDPNDRKSGFNDFSMDNFALSDLPAMIKFIKSKTGNKKMSFFGHSQGTTIFFMLEMHDPTFAEESIDHFVSLGTVNNLVHTTLKPIILVGKMYNIFRGINILGSIYFSNFQRELLANFCKIFPGICGKICDIAASTEPTGKTDYKNLYNLLYYFPGGISTMNILHWGQIHKMKNLVYYNPNFHKEKTAKEYNTDNLKKWKIKSLIARTDGDTFSSYQDVTDFYNNVEDKSVLKMLDIDKYGHLDCLTAKTAPEEIFMPAIEFLKE